MIPLNMAKAILRNRLGILQYPSFVTFIITWRCNSRCIFCDIWRKKADINNELSANEIEYIFKQLKKIDVLRITGGEPFIRQDFSDVINRINSINSPSVIHITTNGFLTNQIINSMNDIDAIDKVHIKVSIDAVGEKHDQVRGTKGAYEMAMKTIEGLCKLRNDRPFHIAVNQAIINENEISSYFQLKEILAPLDVPVNPCIATVPLKGLYSDKILVNPDNSYKPFGSFSKESLDRFMKILIVDGEKVNNLQEQIVHQYQLKGAYNRLVNNKQIPNPKCVALKSHLRILPNGDVPVCLYNGNIIGNLKIEEFNTIWSNSESKKQRNWIKKCPGCWQGCESIVNAIYSGDIWRGYM